MTMFSKPSVFSKIILILYWLTIFIFLYRNSIFTEIKGPAFETSPGELYLFLFLFSFFGIVLWYLISNNHLELKILKLTVLLTFTSLLFVKPFFSQDIYWNLLHSKNFVHDINPYINKPVDYETDSLLSLLKIWEDFPMTHGPLNVYLYAIPYLFTDNLHLVLISLRLIWFLVLISSAKYVFDNMQDNNVKYIFLTSPFVLINTVLDLHNDVFVVLSLALSYYFLKRNMHNAAFISLLPGVLIKYVTLVIIPAILINWIKSSGLKIKTILHITGVLIISALIVILFYLPFTKEINNINVLFTGLNIQANFYFPQRQFIISYLLLDNQIITPTILKVVGFIVGMILGIVLIIKKKPEEAYIFSPGILILSSSWLMPWYFIWIMPFILIRYKNIFTNVLYATFTLIPLSFIALSIIYSTTIPFIISIKYALKNMRSKSNEL